MGEDPGDLIRSERNVTSAVAAAAATVVWRRKKREMAYPSVAVDMMLDQIDFSKQQARKLNLVYLKSSSADLL